MQAAPADTLIALATPPGVGAVALLRLSGPAAREIAEKLFSRKLKPRRAVHGELRDSAGSPIDDGLAIYFPAPNSYTGEETVELTPHGSPVIVQRLIEAAILLGARAARPGEFTYRAFINGRLDLNQAEAVDALIRAETDAERAAARRSLTGELGRRLAPLEERWRELLSRLEGAVEFVEERIDFTGGGARVTEAVAGLDAELAAIEKEFARGELLRGDLTVALVGPPNAGKSTLFNFLARAEAAIVSAIPGTTRDLLRERVEIRGLKVRLTDTAGVRDTTDEIELLGVARARAAGAAASKRLLLLDGTDHPDNFAQLAQWPAGDTLVILSHGDRHPPRGSLLAALRARNFSHHATALTDPARQGELREMIEEFIAPAREQGEALAASPRARALLAQTRATLAMASRACARGASEEFLLEPLWEGLHLCGQLTRPTDREEIYGLIFSNFCIGK